MAYNGATWDEANPTNNTLANEIDDVARDIKIGVRGRMNQEHVWPAVQVATNEGGMHRYLTMSMQTSPPDLVIGTNTQAGALYITSGGALIFQNSASTAVSVVAAGARSALPAGAIMPYGGTSAPTGFYICDGQAYSRTTDSALYAAIQTIYGTGDGSTTFNVPDIRGCTIVGKSAAGIFATLAATTGAVTHVLTEAEMPAHAHDLYGRNAAGEVSGSYKYLCDIDATDGATGLTITDMQTVGSGGAHNNVQPSIVLNYIIAR